MPVATVSTTASSLTPQRSMATSFTELEETFESQGAGPNGVFVKVGLEEPLVGVDVYGGSNEAEAFGAAKGVVNFDAAHHAHGVVGVWRDLRIIEGWMGGFFGLGRLVQCGVPNPDLVGQRLFAEIAEVGVALVDVGGAGIHVELVILNNHSA